MLIYSLVESDYPDMPVRQAKELMRIKDGLVDWLLVITYKRAGCSQLTTFAEKL